jgi:hypothetical protein
MAIFGHFDKDPNPIPETITQRYGDRINKYDKEAIRSLHEWVQSPCLYDNAGGLNNIINNIIPDPHEMTLMHFENMGQGTKLNSQEFIVIHRRR